MNITVIIPARNEEKFLPDTLDSIKPQLHFGDEIIVVDNESTDLTPMIAEVYGCRVLRANDMWIGLNEAVVEAKNPIIFKTDADTLIPLGHLDAIRLYFLNNEDLVGVSGPIRDKDRTLFGDAVAGLTNKLWKGVGANQAFLKKAFVSAGGYPTWLPRKLICGKDVMFWNRLKRVGETVHDHNLTVHTDMNTWKARTVPLLALSSFSIGGGYVLRKVETREHRILGDAVMGFGAGLALAEIGSKSFNDRALVILKLEKKHPIVQSRIHHSALGMAIILSSAFIAGLPIKNETLRDEVASALAGFGAGIFTHDLLTDKRGNVLL